MGEMGVTGRRGTVARRVGGRGARRGGCGAWRGGGGGGAGGVGGGRGGGGGGGEGGGGGGGGGGGREGTSTSPLCLFISRENEFLVIHKRGYSPPLLSSFAFLSFSSPLLLSCPPPFLLSSATFCLFSFRLTQSLCRRVLLLEKPLTTMFISRALPAGLQQGRAVATGSFYPRLSLSH